MNQDQVFQKALWGPVVDYPNVPVHFLIEKQAVENPTKTAILLGDQTISYSELNQRANQLARYLIEKGFGPKDLIGIYMGRSLETIVAILGVIKTGAAYIPLDSAYPAERINYIITDAGMSLMLTQASYLKGGAKFQTQALCTDEIARSIAAQSKENVPIAVTPEQRMYVIYTSGSTGNPKGVQITHSAVVNFLMSMRKEPGINEEDQLLFITTICFDISGLEIFLPLVSGAAIVMAPYEIAIDGIELAKMIEKNDITIMQATPATWQMLIDTGWPGKKNLKILCGGEALSRELANKLATKGACLWNMYGPTETTIWSMIHQVEYGENAVSIGKPIDNTQIYILNDALAPVSGDEAGELYIGGAGLSIGYLGKPELTEKRFIPNPFKEDPSAFIYKTGDLVKYNVYGLVEYLGRADFQVKIRGHRIELEEIERVLEKHPQVSSVVAVVSGSEQNKKLIVYYKKRQGAQNPSNDELMNLLKETLPDYMIPALLVPMEEFPLTLNGKVDRKRLMELNIEGGSHRKNYVAPSTPIEKELAQIWEELLLLKDIGVNDNFLELGGHSLLANRILLKINQAFEINLTIVELLTKGLTIAELALLVEEKLFESISESELEEMLKEAEALKQGDPGDLK